LLPEATIDPLPAAQTTLARRASASLLVSATLFAAMAMLARLVSRSIPGPQVALVRFSFGVAVVAGAWAVFRVELRPHRWRWLIARGLFGGTSVLLYFTCIEHLGVGRATLLNYTSPVWSLLFGWILLKERPRPHAVPALVLTLVGVVLIVGRAGGAWRVSGWDLLGELSAVFAGMAVTAIRAARRSGDDGTPAESHWSVFASFTLLGMLATLPPVLPPFGHWVVPSARAWLLLLFVGVTGVWGQLIMTRALKHITATAMGIIHQVTVALTVLGGLIFFGETLTLRSAIGSAITVAGVLWVVYSE
jgi:drug/metabolite transporter (DMT)-like permease